MIKKGQEKVNKKYSNDKEVWRKNKPITTAKKGITKKILTKHKEGEIIIIHIGNIFK